MDKMSGAKHFSSFNLDNFKRLCEQRTKKLNCIFGLLPSSRVRSEPGTNQAQFRGTEGPIAYFKLKNRRNFCSVQNVVSRTEEAFMYFIRHSKSGNYF